MTGWVCGLLLAVPVFGGGAVYAAAETVPLAAATPIVFGRVSARDEAARQDQWQLSDLKKYPLGIRGYELNQNSSLTGWKLTKRWYLGRSRMAKPLYRNPIATPVRPKTVARKGLVLVRDGAKTRVAVGTDGVEFKLRF